VLGAQHFDDLTRQNISPKNKKMPFDQSRSINAVRSKPFDQSRSIKAVRSKPFDQSFN